MDKQMKFETVESSELLAVSGGIWDYSNRMGYLGSILEAKQDGKNHDLLNPPKNLDEAAGRALQGWVSLK